MTYFNLRVVSGVQPTGELHLGNYIGAIRNMVQLQSTYECVILVADLHALTMRIEKEALKSNTFNTIAMLLACGIDPSSEGSGVILAQQSTVVGRSGLPWYLECVARIGWLNRMVQFKTKSENAESESVGLYAYPVLQAADILLFKGTLVPVGEDQMQHLNLVRDIAAKFNRDTKTEVFPIPEALVPARGGRVMSLRDPTIKMSKSDFHDNARINLNDSPDVIRAKLRKAVTGSTCMPGRNAEIGDLHGIRNLAGIHSVLSGVPVADTLARHAGGNFGPFKDEVAEVIIEHLRPIQDEYFRLRSASYYLDERLKNGIDHALDMASSTVGEVEEALGIR